MLMVEDCYVLEYNSSIFFISFYFSQLVRFVNSFSMFVLESGYIQISLE